VRLGDEASEKAPRRLRFAAASPTSRPDPAGTVKLKLRVRTSASSATTTKRRLRGVMEIRNTAGTAISNTRITIKLKKRP
jgi:hypothetical protein